MKKLSLFVLLLMYCDHLIAQIDSALQYRKASRSFYTAVQATQAEIMADNPADTSESGEANEFRRWAERVDNHLCRNVLNNSMPAL